MRLLVSGSCSSLQPNGKPTQVGHRGLLGGEAYCIAVWGLFWHSICEHISRLIQSIFNMFVVVLVAFFSPFVMGSPPKFHSNVLPISTIVKSFLYLTATTTNKTYFVIWNGKCQFVFGLLHNGTASPPTPTFHLREFKISTFHASSKLTCSSQAASHFI